MPLSIVGPLDPSSGPKGGVAKNDDEFEGSPCFHMTSLRIRRLVRQNFEADLLRVLDPTPVLAHHRRIVRPAGQLHAEVEVSASD